MRRPVKAALSCLAVVSVTAAMLGTVTVPGTAQAGSTPPPCTQPQRPGPPVTPTTVTTIGQAYYCILAHYYAGPTMDDRVLLAGGFAGLTQELDRLGADQADAAMPALTGDHDADWDAFAAVYQRVISELAAQEVQQVAEATMSGMVAALHDNHADWLYPQPPPESQPGDTYGLGITTSPGAPVAQGAPGEALPPLFVTAVAPRSPAASAGVRPGDVITTVNGSAPFTGGEVSPGVIDLLNQTYPQQQSVQITLSWPVDGATRTIRITPAVYPSTSQTATSQLLHGDIVKITLPRFSPDLVDQVLTAITDQEKTATLRGIILDLRGNTGGGGGADSQLLGAFEHGTPWSYDCTITDQCTPAYPDDTTPLLHLPLVLLTDRNCESACDVFSGAVKDLHLGTLIGTRTAGIVAGRATGWQLDDGSVLGFPAEHGLGANHELIDGIGVAPDYTIPFTAYDLAAGHDPGLAKALTVLSN